MLGKADHLWRLFWTGASFAVFGLGALVLGAPIFGAIHLFVGPPARAQRLCRYGVHLSFRFFIAFMRGTGVLSYQVERQERLRREGLLVVANHPSLIDVIFIVAHIPDAYCIVKRAAWRNPFMALIMRSTGFIPNDEPDQLIRACSQLLERNETIVMFPEGTRTIPGQSMIFRRGAAAVALKANKALTPVYLSVSPSTLSKGMPWYKVPKQRVSYRLVVGEDIEPYSVTGSPQQLRQVTRAVNDRLVDHFENQTAELQKATS